MWSFDSGNDKKFLSDHAITTAAKLTAQHADLLFSSYSPKEFAAAVDFLKKCKKGYIEEINKMIKVYEQKAKGE